MPKTPVLLLKTKSYPADTYDELFSSTGDYEPTFVPVLQHTNVNADVIKEAILNWEVVDAGSARGEARYGGLIITSQRAVEALAVVVEKLKVSNLDKVAAFLSDTLIYVVGPATRKALVSLGFSSENVLGEESGNGASLADFIVDDYESTEDLLFLVGETHGTVIPQRLREKEPKVHVEEVVVYKTVTRTEFEEEFRSVLNELDAKLERLEITTEGEEFERWVVVFSPSGTDAALKVIKEKEKAAPGKVTYRICTIGPTTKDYMWHACKKRPDAMARSPSPEGLLEAIKEKSWTRRAILDVTL